jgi:hypothetical protein
MSKHFSENVPIHDGLCFITAAFQLCFRNLQENHVGLKLNGTHQLLPNADDVNLLQDNIDIIKKNTETLTDDSREAGLEINMDRTECVLLSCQHNSEKYQDIKIANRLFQNMS